MIKKNKNGGEITRITLLFMLIFICSCTKTNDLSINNTKDGSNQLSYTLDYLASDGTYTTISSVCDDSTYRIETFANGISTQHSFCMVDENTIDFHVVDSLTVTLLYTNLDTNHFLLRLTDIAQSTDTVSFNLSLNNTQIGAFSLVGFSPDELGNFLSSLKATKAVDGNPWRKIAREIGQSVLVPIATEMVENLAKDLLPSESIQLACVDAFRENANTCMEKGGSPYYHHGLYHTNCTFECRMPQPK